MGEETGTEPPRRQRVAAYAVIRRHGQVLLSRLAPSISEVEMWTLPGGGIDFGEPPAEAVVREVWEETGLTCTVGRPFFVGSARRVVDRDDDPTDLHSVRLVYDAWVPPDSPEPRVLEVDGSTDDARWWPEQDILEGRVPTVPMVRQALAEHRPVAHQRVSAYALVVREEAVLLTRHSAKGPRPGTWSLPGGGIEHGESPAAAVVREVAEECGLTAVVGEVVGVHDERFTGTAPHGRVEDFHAVHLVFATEVGAGEPHVGSGVTTTDAARWVPLADVRADRAEVTPLVVAALDMLGQ